MDASVSSREGKDSEVGVIGREWTSIMSGLTAGQKVAHHPALHDSGDAIALTSPRCEDFRCRDLFEAYPAALARDARASMLVASSVPACLHPRS